MTTIAKTYRELLTLAQTHILDEYQSKEWLFTDADTLIFYQQHLPKKEPPPQVPLPQQHKPPPTVQQQSPQNPPLRKHQPKRTEQEQSPPEKTPHAPEMPAAPPQNSGTKSKKSFTLEPVVKPDESDLGSMKKLIQELAPDTVILEAPDDFQAKNLGQRWKHASQQPEVILLCFDEIPEEMRFLNNVSKAIDVCFAPAKIYSAQKIEQHCAWPQIFNSKDLKLIITTDYGLYALPGLMQHYRESPNKSNRYLGGVPVLLLTQIKLYLQNPHLKQALWKALSAGFIQSRDVDSATSSGSNNSSNSRQNTKDL